MSDADLIDDIEARAGGVEQAFTMLGVSQSAWYRYRSAGILPIVVLYSVEAHLMLKPKDFEFLKVSRVRK